MEADVPLAFVRAALVRRAIGPSIFAKNSHSFCFPNLIRLAGNVAVELLMDVGLLSRGCGVWVCALKEKGPWLRVSPEALEKPDQEARRKGTRSGGAQRTATRKTGRRDEPGNRSATRESARKVRGFYPLLITSRPAAVGAAKRAEAGWMVLAGRGVIRNREKSITAREASQGESAVLQRRGGIATAVRAGCPSQSAGSRWAA